MPYKDPHSPEAKASTKRSCSKYYAKNKQSFADRWKKWCKDNPERRKEQKHKDTMKNLETNVAKILAWKQADPDRRRRSAGAYHRREKERFIEAYGGKCQCCGEPQYEFLTLEHVFGRGKEERKQFGLRLYLKARKEGYPKDKYQCLCWNCNAAKGVYGKCPHQKIEHELRLVSGC